ncbi:hypothetical protein KP509_28G043300 [Ceratopteris richardii]|uniref:Uncharacterized protein n=1 Tax=Ceratopteris richardii TaxID=49495 RepID=A0A8T2RDT6_CERRI|nr:hypothetical protein KP509_28G043300 [Ceratopteris richardii]
MVSRAFFLAHPSLYAPAPHSTTQAPQSPSAPSSLPLASANASLRRCATLASSATPSSRTDTPRDRDASLDPVQRDVLHHALVDLAPLLLAPFSRHAGLSQPVVFSPPLAYASPSADPQVFSLAQALASYSEAGPYKPPLQPPSAQRSAPSFLCLQLRHPDVSYDKDLPEALQSASDVHGVQTTPQYLPRPPLPCAHASSLTEVLSNASFHPSSPCTSAQGIGFSMPKQQTSDQSMAPRVQYVAMMESTSFPAHLNHCLAPSLENSRAPLGPHKLALPLSLSMALLAAPLHRFPLLPAGPPTRTASSSPVCNSTGRNHLPRLTTLPQWPDDTASMVSRVPFAALPASSPSVSTSPSPHFTSTTAIRILGETSHLQARISYSLVHTLEKKVHFIPTCATPLDSYAMRTHVASDVAIHAKTSPAMPLPDAVHYTRSSSSPTVVFFSVPFCSNQDMPPCGRRYTTDASSEPYASCLARAQLSPCGRAP